MTLNALPSGEEVLFAHAANFFDKMTTLIGVMLGLQEGNIVMRWGIEAFGILGAVILAFTITFTAIEVFRKAPGWLVDCYTVICLVVVSWNIYAILSHIGGAS